MSKRLKIMSKRLKAIHDRIGKVAYKISPSLSVLILITNPFITMMSIYLAYKNRGYFAIGGEIIVAPLLTIIWILLLMLHDRLSKKYRVTPKISIPVRNHRYTYKDRRGDISIDTSDIQEIILYLAEVEDYCERRGIYEE